MKKICSIPGCGKPADSRSWCASHYMRWWKRGGDPSKVSENYHDRSTDPAGLKRRLDKKWKLNKATGCWQWTGATSKPSAKYSYTRGRMFIDKVSWPVHRLSWVIHKGNIPPGMHVLHTCDNSLCVNPDHLYLGDHAKNMDDMAKRGRSAHLKLTPEQVKFIRNSSMSHRALAKLFGLDKSSIQAVRKFESHKHIT